MDAGYGGRLTLVSVNDMETVKFYWDKVGCVDLKGGVFNELELTVKAAKKFMEKY
jgi:hypothetical protein